MLFFFYALCYNTQKWGFIKNLFFITKKLKGALVFGMKIEKLSVENFRNLKPQTISFSDGLNVLCGKNAQGKTNTIEAIYLSTIGRSPRTRKDSEMIAYFNPSLMLSVGLDFSHQSVEHSIAFKIKGQNKQVFVDGNKLDKISDVIGNFGSVYFDPQSIELIHGGPANRRKFMDIINCQLSKNYLKALQSFQHILDQRNALLKTDGDTQKQMAAWDEQVAKFGTFIYNARKSFCSKLLPKAKQIHKNLVDDEDFELDYISFLENENTEQSYVESLKKTYEKDKVLGYTTFGVQNDDFIVKINSKDARRTGSYGQIRTVALSLKLAEHEILKEEYGDYPVLLVDDILSSLDKDRRQKLVEYISGFQCVITCNDFDVDIPCKKFVVSDGQIEEL